MQGLFLPESKKGTAAISSGAGHRLQKRRNACIIRKYGLCNDWVAADADCAVK